MRTDTSKKTLTENRRAAFDYDILETYEAGLELSGREVKSVKDGKMQISGSYALIRGGEAWLLNAVVPPYQPKNTPPDYNPARNRRLLLHKKEIKELSGRLHEKGLSLLPLRVYLKGELIKIELGLGRRRKKHDKRELLKKRAVEKESKK